MPEAAPALFAWYTPGFTDPLGDRLLLFDNTEGRPLELLRLCSVIAEAPDAESHLRARTHELSTLADERLARVCRVDRLPQPGGGLAIVSEHVEGQRLSEFLAIVGHRDGRIGADLAVTVLSKLVGALAVLHGAGPHVAHGALAPERVVVAPGGRVVVTEYVLGSVLREVALDRDKLWRQLRVALPASPRPVLDQRTDVLQVGLVALAMLVGRPLHADEHAGHAAALLVEAAARTREARWDPARWSALRDWLSRALGLVPGQGFDNAVEAARALEAVGVGEEADFTSRITGEDQPKLVSAEPSVSPVHRSLPESRRTDRRRRPTRRARPPVLATVLALSVGAAGLYAGARALNRVEPASPAPRARATNPPAPALPNIAPSTLDIRSEPAGVRVFVDGQLRGVTPLAAADLGGGAHQVRLESEGRSITELVSLEPGRTATLFVPFRVAGAPAAGWLTIAAAVELQVYEDDRFLGTSRADRIMLPSGRHRVSLVNDAIGFRTTQDIHVPLGRTATVDVPLPSGRADINAAPWAEVWIDGEKAGETPLAAFPLRPGRHTVTFKHPRLGERSVDCFVTLQETLRLSADLRK